jgi:DNA-binding beta-propeller fold protein YncE
MGAPFYVFTAETNTHASSSDVRCYEPDTGTEVWTTSVDIGVRHLTVDYDGNPWVLGSRWRFGDPEVIKFDAHTGAQLGHVDSDDSSTDEEFMMYGLHVDADGFFYVVDESSEREILKMDLDGNVDDDTGNTGTDLSALDGNKSNMWVSDGLRRFLVTLDPLNDFRFTRATGSGDLPVVVSPDGGVYHLKGRNTIGFTNASGDEQWRRSAGQDPVQLAPAGDWVYVILRSDPDITKVWRWSDNVQPTETISTGNVDSIYAGPDGSVFYTRGFSLFRLDTETDTTLWSTSTTNESLVATAKLDADVDIGPNLDLAAPEVQASTSESITWTWQTID